MIIADFVDCWAIHGFGVVADCGGEADWRQRRVGVVAVFALDFLGFFGGVVHPDFALVFADEFACGFYAVARDVGECALINKNLQGLLDLAEVVCAVDDEVYV